MQELPDSPDDATSDSAENFSVVVAYLNSAGDLQARALLERVGRGVGQSGRMICSLWDFKSLAAPALAAVAVAAAQEAHVIVIATQEGKPLPPAVRNWISNALLIRPNHPRALVAVLDRDPAPSGIPQVVRPYLEEIARSGGMEFFASASAAITPLVLEELQAPPAGTNGSGNKRVAKQTAPATGGRARFTGIYARATPAAKGGCPAVS